MLTNLLLTTTTLTRAEVEQEILSAIQAVQEHTPLEKTAETPLPTEDALEANLLTAAKKITKEEKDITVSPVQDKFVDGMYHADHSLDTHPAEQFSYTSQFGRSYYTGTEKEEPEKVVYAQEGETFSNKEWEKYLEEKKMENITRVNRTYSDALPRMMHTGTEDEQLRTFISKISWRHSWNKVKYVLSLG